MRVIVVRPLTWHHGNVGFRDRVSAYDQRCLDTDNRAGADRIPERIVDSPNRRCMLWVLWRDSNDHPLQEFDSIVRSQDTTLHQAQVPLGGIWWLCVRALNHGLHAIN